MSADKKKNKQVEKDRRPEPFPEPRTLPTKWDLSEMNGTDAEPKAEGPPPSVRIADYLEFGKPDQNLPSEEQTIKNPESFPKQRTVPDGWDFAEL